MFKKRNLFLSTTVLLSLAVLTITGLALSSSQYEASAAPSGPFIGPLGFPKDAGYRVKEVLGLRPVAELGGEKRTHVLFTHPVAGEFIAWCLDPGKDIPNPSSDSERRYKFDGTDLVPTGGTPEQRQRLQRFRPLEPPPPPPPTKIPVPTNTPTATPTPTNTPTPTPTDTLTPIPTNPPSPGGCSSVKPSSRIDKKGQLIIEGTGSVSAEFWAVVRVSDGEIMDSELEIKKPVDFQFEGEYKTQYQLRGVNENGESKAEGCVFSFDPPDPTPLPPPTKKPQPVTTEGAPGGRAEYLAVTVGSTIEAFSLQVAEVAVSEFGQETVNTALYVQVLVVLSFFMLVIAITTIPLIVKRFRNRR